MALCSSDRRQSYKKVKEKITVNFRKSSQKCLLLSRCSAVYFGKSVKIALKELDLLINFFKK